MWETTHGVRQTTDGNHDGSWFEFEFHTIAEIRKRTSKTDAKKRAGQNHENQILRRKNTFSSFGPRRSSCRCYLQPLFLPMKQFQNCEVLKYTVIVTNL